jgi:hypothetical protein
MGTSTLRVLGPATGRHYWFGAPGAMVLVEARDAPFLDAVPRLRKAGGGG